MEVNINICCDNAAFTESSEQEVGRILKNIIQKINYRGLEDFNLFDLNGNCVGEVNVLDS